MRCSESVVRMSSSVREIAIIGAGHGGCAAAADLTLRGFSVRLYGRSSATIAPIRWGIPA